MARRSLIVKNEKRRRMATKHHALRVELRKKVKDMNLSTEDRTEAMARLQRLPRNSSEVRVRNRCELTGRSRGFLKTFRLSRIAFRELALKGMIPGVKKSSW